MNKMNDFNAVFTVVSGIIRNITNNPDLLIEAVHTANDIKNWDSLRHVMIINEIENHFAIQFDLIEILDITSVGDLCNAISRKKKPAG